MPHFFSRLVSFAATLLTLLAADKPTVHHFEDQAEGALPEAWKSAKTGEGQGSAWKVVA